ncbi:OB-fold domain-containing protein [Dactylosporangium roseum]|uniref:OB-fold domain-containing protein n=1 Tax=Dactylosporangium roseum TaxID=47989 RepID=A0ABY5Z0X4_9ACTN|nr:OB-fold domain-containing protein [Dactylosporangium roseum]UWZ34428.1 OB-fold domain-containing protein [Dactylosporangium roseum]
MDKPLPVATATSAPFWTGLRDRKVLLQYSPSTGSWVYYPRVLAPLTLADDLEWREVGGTGSVYTFTVAHRPTSSEWAGDVPQLLAVVEFDEGPRCTSELVNVAPEEIKVGMRVRPVFVDVGDVTLLKFEPEGAA